MVFAVGDMIDFEAVAREVAGQESEQGEKHTHISFRGSNAEPRSGDVGSHVSACDAAVYCCTLKLCVLRTNVHKLTINARLSLREQMWHLLPGRRGPKSQICVATEVRDY